MNKTTLNKATSPDPNPTPGYLFDEIAKVTHDPIGNDRLVEYLLKRLESPSADVKAKVLNIVKHVCRKGNPSFRRAWQRESPAVKAHLQYHTAPDPLRGDEPSRRVRECAKEALAAIFDASQDERRGDPAIAGRIQGFGVAPVPPTPTDVGSQSRIPSSFPSMSSGGGGSSNVSIASQPRYSSGSRYEGIGNPNFQDPRNQPKSLLERVAEAVRDKVERPSEAIAGVGGVKPPWMTQTAPDLQGGGYNYASNRGPSSYMSNTGSYDPTASQRTSVSSSSNAWVDPRSPRTGTGSLPSVQPLSQTNGGSTIGSHSARSRQAEPSDGTYERNLIEELCAPGGVRPVPPKDKLDAFCKACRTLDHNWVITLLDEKLAEDDWKVQHKALCVLEAILQAPGLDAYADRLDASPDNLEALYNSKNPSVKERAQRVWRLLYDDNDGGNAGGSNGGLVEDNTPSLMPEYDSAPAPSSRTPEQQNAGQINLLDFGEVQTTNSLGLTSQPAAAKSTTDAMSSMFGNLSVKAKPAGVPQAAVPAASAPSSGFSFLSSGSPAPVAAPSPAANLFDLPISQPSPAKPVSTLDFLSMPATTTVQPPQGNPIGADPFASFNMPPGAGLQPIAPAPAPVRPSTTLTSGVPQPQQQKKVDSFSFVQEALQTTRRT